MITTAVYPENMPTIGNETSIPPLIITIKTPRAKRSCTIDDRRMSNRFAIVKNSGLFDPTTIAKMMIAKIKTVSFLRRSFRRFILI